MIDSCFFLSTAPQTCHTSPVSFLLLEELWTWAYERTSAHTRRGNAAFLQQQPLVGEPRDCSLGRTSPSRDPPFFEVTPYKEVESWGRLWQVGTGWSKAGQLLKAVWSSLNAWSEQFSHRQKVLLVSLLQFQDPGHLFFCNLISTQSTQITSIDVVSAGNMQPREESAVQSKFSKIYKCVCV